MRRVKGIALWSFGLLLLSATGIVVFLAAAGDDFDRWAARQLLERAIGHRVHVEGTFSFDVGLEPTLTFTDIWIENAPWAENKEMVRVERADVQIALKPLLAGNIRILRLVVRDLTLDLERGPSPVLGDQSYCAGQSPLSAETPGRSRATYRQGADLRAEGYGVDDFDQTSDGSYLRDVGVAQPNPAA